MDGTDIVAVQSRIARCFLYLRDVEDLGRVSERAHRCSGRDDRRAARNYSHILLLFAIRHQLNWLTVSVTQSRVIKRLFVPTVPTTHFSNKIK